MKKTFFVVLLLLCANALFAQKFGYVDTEYILKKVPEYAEAQKEIDRLSVEYQKEIEKMYIERDSLYNAYKREEILLTEEMKEKRLEEIEAKEKQIKEFQRKIFGFNGLIFLKRQELIEPIQDKVYEAVKKVAKAYKLQIVFDKAGDLTMIYASPVHDYTDYVLEELELGDKLDTIDNPRHKK